LLRYAATFKSLSVFVLLLCLGVTALLGVEYQTYKVKKGDTLYSISKRHGMTVVELKTLNGLTGDALSLGQKLKVKSTAKPKPAAVTPSTGATTGQPASTSKKKKPEAPPGQTQPAGSPASAASEPRTGAVSPPVAGSAVITDFGEAYQPPTDLPEEYYHTVQPKENLFRISQKYGITVPDLLKYNKYPDTHVLVKAGLKLIIKDPTPVLQARSGQTPATETAEEGISEEHEKAEGDSVLIEKIYIVQRKDTLFKIAKAYNMSVEELKALNKLKDNALKTGQRLYIKAPKGAETEAALSAPPLLTEEELKTKERIRTDLIMPTDGKAISEYGIRNGRPHKGIDIGAASGSPIFSVLDGTVVYVGYQGNYGNVIVVEHPDYIMTVYAHNEKNLVAVGDVVKQGQIIGTVGSTGNATAPHVHFEYRIKGKAINPRKVLPFSQ